MQIVKFFKHLPNFLAIDDILNPGLNLSYLQSTINCVY